MVMSASNADHLAQWDFKGLDSDHGKNTVSGAKKTILNLSAVKSSRL